VARRRIQRVLQLQDHRRRIQPLVALDVAGAPGQDQTVAAGEEGQQEGVAVVGGGVGIAHDAAARKQIEGAGRALAGEGVGVQAGDRDESVGQDVAGAEGCEGEGARPRARRAGKLAFQEPQDQLGKLLDAHGAVAAQAQGFQRLVQRATDSGFGRVLGDVEPRVERGEEVGGHACRFGVGAAQTRAVGVQALQGRAEGLQERRVGGVEVAPGREGIGAGSEDGAFGGDKRREEEAPQSGEERVVRGRFVFVGTVVEAPAADHARPFAPALPEGDGRGLEAEPATAQSVAQHREHGGAVEGTADQVEEGFHALRPQAFRGRHAQDGPGDVAGVGRGEASEYPLDLDAVARRVGEQHGRVGNRPRGVFGEP